jgi:hypothetical protein
MFFEKPNYKILIIGMDGSGKTVKIIIVILIVYFSY